MKLRLKSLNLNERGLERIFGSLEIAILEQMWQCQEASVKDIHSKLEDKNLAYTTIMTVMGRLNKKGILSKRKEQAAHIYKVIYTKTEIEKLMIDQLIGSFDDLAIPTVMHFLDTLDADTETIEELEKMIAAKKALLKSEGKKCD